MMGRYRERFVALSPEAVSLVWERTRAGHPSLRPPGDQPTGEQLYDVLLEAGLSQAEAVMSIARETGPVAESAIATLVGHAVTRRQVQVAGGGTVVSITGDQPLRRQHRAPAARSDPRVIHLAVPSCPKKPGTNAWNLWQLYRDGMTVDEYIHAGGTRAAIRYDSEHGFITLEGTGVTQQ